MYLLSFDHFIAKINGWIVRTMCHSLPPSPRVSETNVNSNKIMKEETIAVEHQWPSSSHCRWKTFTVNISRVAARSITDSATSTLVPPERCALFFFFFIGANAFYHRSADHIYFVSFLDWCIFLRFGISWRPAYRERCDRLSRIFPIVHNSLHNFVAVVLAFSSAHWPLWLTAIVSSWTFCLLFSSSAAVSPISLRQLLCRFFVVIRAVLLCHS